mmetsp:Transcript_57915/g.160163  ORF Transcript_57915/g.160163 Transcript_57915/m.160163 type:complete len:215 (+) Transcript_57915:486-1130(+)
MSPSAAPSAAAALAAASPAASAGASAAAQDSAVVHVGAAGAAAGDCREGPSPMRANQGVAEDSTGRAAEPQEEGGRSARAESSSLTGSRQACSMKSPLRRASRRSGLAAPPGGDSACAHARVQGRSASPKNDAAGSCSSELPWTALVAARVLDCCALPEAVAALPPEAPLATARPCKLERPPIFGTGCGGVADRSAWLPTWSCGISFGARGSSG